MEYEWDDAKNRANRSKHGISFSAVETFNWSTCTQKLDDRRDYGEARYIATGFIRERLHILVYTLRGENIRVIGLRKANPREVKHYEQTQT